MTTTSCRINDTHFPIKWKYNTVIEGVGAKDILTHLNRLSDHVIGYKKHSNYLKKDLLILKKMIYRNKNSQRQHKFFQYLTQISRTMQKVKDVKYLKNVSSLVPVLDESISPFHTSLPTRKAIEYCMCQLLVVAGLLVKVLCLCVSVYRHIKQNVYEAFLLNKQLVYLGIVSRVWAVVRCCLCDMEGMYGGLLVCLRFHPKYSGRLINSTLPTDWRSWLEKTFPEESHMVEKHKTSLDTREGAADVLMRETGAGETSSTCEQLLNLLPEDLGAIVDRDTFTQREDDGDQQRSTVKFSKKLTKLFDGVRKLKHVLLKQSHDPMFLQLTEECFRKIGVLVRSSNTRIRTLNKVDMQLIRVKTEKHLKKLFAWAKDKPPSKAINVLNDIKTRMNTL